MGYAWAEDAVSDQTWKQLLAFLSGMEDCRTKFDDLINAYVQSDIFKNFKEAETLWASIASQVSGDGLRLSIHEQLKSFDFNATWPAIAASLVGAKDPARISMTLVSGDTSAFIDGVAPNIASAKRPRLRLAIDNSQSIVAAAELEHAGICNVSAQGEFVAAQYEVSVHGQAIDRQADPADVPSDGGKKSVTDADPARAACDEPIRIMEVIVPECGQYLGVDLEATTPKIYSPGSAVDGATVIRVRVQAGHWQFELRDLMGVNRSFACALDDCQALLSMKFHVRTRPAACNDETY